LYFILNKNLIFTFLQKPDETNERGKKPLKRLRYFCFLKIKKKTKKSPQKSSKKVKIILKET